MNRYRATELHDNDLPWFCWDQNDHSKTRPMTWGTTLQPVAIGEAEWQWDAMLPEGTKLPNWIHEI